MGAEPMGVLPTWPTPDRSRVPFFVYTDPAVFAAEQERIFRGPVWHYLGLEAEIPRPGDFIRSYIGTTPIVLNRAMDGSLTAFVNRCAHRGATVVREARGNCKGTHTCIYHQWSYGQGGDLQGVPYRRGISGIGGFPADFRLEDNNLRTVRIEIFAGIVFGTLSDTPPTLADFLGDVVSARILRMFNRPVRVAGYQRHRLRGNWKLMIENVKDAYHGALLHAFNSKFGFFRSTQRGDVSVGGGGVHSILTTYNTVDERAEIAFDSRVQTFKPSLTLEDNRMTQVCDKFDDGIITSIVSVFPSFLLLHGPSFMCFRHVHPKSADSFEMTWTYLGYEDDDEEQAKGRVLQANLFGPAGYVSMEDAEAIEMVQRAITGEGGMGQGIVALGGSGIETEDHLVTEVAIRGFWNGYRNVMGFQA